MVRSRKARIFIACGVSTLLVFGLAIWARQRPTPVPLSLIQGVPLHEFRKAEVGPNGATRFSRAIYYVRIGYDEAISRTKKDLVGWDTGNSGGGGKWWHERPGPFQSHGHQVHIRRNFIDPDSMEVLGKAEDSKHWLTVTVLGNLDDPNLLRGFWRLLTGNKRP